jgi:hypothetical protein
LADERRTQPVWPRCDKSCKPFSVWFELRRFALRIIGTASLSAMAALNLSCATPTPLRASVPAKAETRREEYSWPAQPYPQEVIRSVFDSRTSHGFPSHTPASLTRSDAPPSARRSIEKQRRHNATSRHVCLKLFQLDVGSYKGCTETSQCRRPLARCADGLKSPLRRSPPRPSLPAARESRSSLLEDADVQLAYDNSCHMRGAADKGEPAIGVLSTLRPRPIH